jgi:hypothetical protein
VVAAGLLVWSRQMTTAAVESIQIISPEEMMANPINHGNLCSASASCDSSFACGSSRAGGVDVVCEWRCGAEEPRSLASRGLHLGVAAWLKCLCSALTVPHV